MNAKGLIWIGACVGATIGGLIPNFFGADALSFASIIMSTMGGIVGIWFAYEISQKWL